ncbi:MAG TPA: Asp-tRNA(Asn)/Glu-tRNA(Gln) amidotransferase subunit GatC [Candidatus Paceibacterota bacterium]|nr:Asp-tRNA(Asn)/Glu-tRNA(Gln) amidotransferase subunit GatC [Candidatus Paceibacterota bacterium]HPT17950.1 Asp-tRNA(Asn)/Glu-tRNA(Gln) amidotransferase subunit GatC [Candidatus Paceibacterota bacterium]
MQIEDVEKLAELAKIELSKEEKENLLSDMEGILNYVKQIQEVKVEDIRPEYNNRNIWREDKLESRDFSSELINKQFPDSKDDFVKVKKIL